MDENFNLQNYITRGVENFVKASLKATLKNPRESAFLAKFALAAKRASGIRKKSEAKGLHIPAFLIASITSRCNLHCEGCYSRDTHATSDGESGKQLTGKEWADIFSQANEMGISFIILAGGEPLLRRDVMEAASGIPGILFPTFTNGVFLNASYMDLFNKHRNLLPVLSLEGDRETTDARRGEGIFDTVAGKMEALKEKGIVFGISVTVTKENMESVFSDDFIKDLTDKGVKFLFFVEYVPIGGNKKETAPDDAEREFIRQRVSEFRAAYNEIVFVSIPGDENTSGGCLAAGRGFFHINHKGDAEACPMSPFSDVNVRDGSLEDALRSPLFASIKEKGLLEGSHKGGCALAEREEQIMEIRENVSAGDNYDTQKNAEEGE